MDSHRSVEIRDLFVPRDEAFTPQSSVTDPSAFTIHAASADQGRTSVPRANEKRVLCVVGTRPEAIKMAPVIHALREQTDCEVRVVSTGQHRELLLPVLDFFGITPDHALDLMRPEQSLGMLTGRMIAALDGVFAQERPRLVLTQGDTTTAFAAALAAFYQQLTCGHIEAGLRTGEKYSPFPEEQHRVLVGRLADLHFAPTVTARQNLLAEGVPSERIFVVGNTVVDALQYATARELPEVFGDLGTARGVLVTAHRRESFGEPLTRICRAIRWLVDIRDVVVLFPVHPNPQVRATVHELLGDHPRIRLVDPLSYPEFVSAMQRATLILTDSGGVQEEAPTLGRPVLVLRETTERVEGVESGSALVVGADSERIVATACELLDDPISYATMTASINPYGDGSSAEQIVAAIMSNVFDESPAEATKAA